jgi:subtilisin family serine protease
MAIAVAVAAMLAFALPGSASALDSGGGQWEPGKLLVRFQNGVGTAERERVAASAGAKLDHAVPLVPNLWELRTTGAVEDVVARLESEAGVVYAQPNYLDKESEDDLGPDSPGYWPTDPYFWPRRFADPNSCGPPTSAGLGSWQFWPFGQNLTDPTAAAAGFSPPPLDQQLTQPWGSARYAVYNSVNVLPVWNLLRLNGRLGGPPNGGWTTDDLKTEGVGVIDTGIAPHPDLNQQIAAEWSVVTSRENEDTGTSTRTRVREVYADAPLRDDITTVRDALEKQSTDRSVEVQEIDRALFLLDDDKGFGISLGQPEQKGAAAQLETLLGCQGHGTAVASLVTARGGNGIGTVGAGYNLPVVGIRDGMPWDQPGVSYANDEPKSIGDAIRAWEQWRPAAEVTNEDRIDEYAIAKALQLPVINMSYGGSLFERAPDLADESRLVVRRPAIVEALARVLSSDRVLGVAAAGNHRELYGQGPKARGARLFGAGKRDHGIQQPCGLSSIGRFKPWIARPVLGHPETAIAEHEWTPGIDWSSLELICVGSTTSINSTLAPSSGSGDAGVAMAAPGEDLTVATRPPLEPPGGQNAYKVGSGTSYAAPLVAGAAALLRRAAPGASMDVIRQALEQGARMNLNLQGKVRDGQLDVACSLQWLVLRRQPDWRLIPISATQDPKAYIDFINATKGCGGQRAPLVTQPKLVQVTKSELVKNFNQSSVGAFLKSINIDYTDRNSAARRWQDLLLAESGVHAGGVGTAFRVGPAAFAHPLTIDGLARPAEVYEAGLVTVGCPASYAISGIDVSLPMIVRPPAWVFPTDAEPPPRSIELAVAVAKPWYWPFVDNTIKVRVRATCQYYPQVTQ